MKPILYLSIFIIIIFSVSSCQDDFDWYQNNGYDIRDTNSRVEYLVLYPSEFNYESEFSASIDSLADHLEKKKLSFQNRIERNNGKIPPNNNYSFSSWHLLNEETDVRSYAQLYLNQRLYGFGGMRMYFQTLVGVNIERKSKGQLDDYFTIAHDYKCDFVIDIPKIDISNQNNLMKCSIQYRLYSTSSNAIEMDFTVNYVVREKWYSLETYHTICQVTSGFSACAFFAGDNLMNRMLFLHSQDEKNNRPDQFNEDWARALDKKPNLFVFNVARTLDSTVNIETYKQGFINKDSTKIFAFFMDTINSEYFKFEYRIPISDPPLFEGISTCRTNFIQAIKHEGVWMSKQIGFSKYFLIDNPDPTINELILNTGCWEFMQDSIDLKDFSIWNIKSFDEIIWTYENLDSLTNGSSMNQFIYTSNL